MNYPIDAEMLIAFVRALGQPGEVREVRILGASESGWRHPHEGSKRQTYLWGANSDAIRRQAELLLADWGAVSGCLEGPGNHDDYCEILLKPAPDNQPALFEEAGK